MYVCTIETLTLKGISTAIYPVLIDENLLPGAEMGEEDFCLRKC